jgi:plastocyanin
MKLMPINGGSDSEDDFESSHQNEMHGDEGGAPYPEVVLESSPRFDNESEVLMAEPVGSATEESLQTLGDRCEQLLHAAGKVCGKSIRAVRSEFNAVDACHALLFLIVLSVLLSQHNMNIAQSNTIEAQHGAILRLTHQVERLHSSVVTLQTQPTGLPTLSPTGAPTLAPTTNPTSMPSKRPAATIGSQNSATVVTGVGKIAFQTPKTVQIAQQTTDGTRTWNPKTTEVYVGDTVDWAWNTNENVVESSSSFTPMAQPRFFSGALSLKGSFSHTAKEPGTYYFASENTATMTGVLVVKPRVTITNGNLDVPGNLTNHGVPIANLLGGTIYAVTTRGNRYTKVNFLRGKNGYNCAHSESMVGFGNGFGPIQEAYAKSTSGYQATSYASWLKLASECGLDPNSRAAICAPPRTAVAMTGPVVSNNHNYVYICIG